MKKLILGLVMLLAVSSVLAINLITSSSIFYNITVEQGYVGPVVYNLSQMFNYSFEWLLQPEISWSTGDNETYLLEVSTEGIGGAFFTGLTNGYITNGTWHKYKLEINIPLNTPVGVYPFEIDGTACAPNLNGGIGICLAGGAGKNVIVIPTTKVCAENWECADWGICSSLGKQTRSCTDLSNCGTTASKPLEIQTCTTCTESWACYKWSSCINWLKTRTCVDRNNCNTVFSKPSTSQSCTCKPKWSCTSWGVCTKGWQTRTCTDKNQCGVTTGKPSIQRSCGGGVRVR